METTIMGLGFSFSEFGGGFRALVLGLGLRVEGFGFAFRIQALGCSVWA